MCVLPVGSCVGRERGRRGQVEKPHDDREGGRPWQGNPIHMVVERARPASHVSLGLPVRAEDWLAGWGDVALSPSFLAWRPGFIEVPISQ